MEAKREPRDDLASADVPVAWSAIIAAHDHTVVVSLLALGIRIDRARDLAQTVWVRLIENHRDAKLETLTFPGLAIAQARFLALTELRKTRTERKYLEPAAAESIIAVADGAPSPESRLASREEIALAFDALEECTAGEQRIFRALWEDPARPHAEVAAQLGISVQRVRQVLCDVRRKIRIAMSDGSNSHE